LGAGCSFFPKSSKPLDFTVSIAGGIDLLGDMLRDVESLPFGVDFAREALADTLPFDDRADLLEEALFKDRSSEE